MTERQIEDLIAQFPDEFFENHKLTLTGRQQSFAEVGRFDLMFTDSHHTNVLMELKAVPAKYEHASQLAKYKDELERRGERNVPMWLVAPHIPTSVRQFLDNIGIEYSEIHEAKFRRVAERHGIRLEPEPGTESVGRVAGRESRRPAGWVSHPAASNRDNPYVLKTDFDRGDLDQLLKKFEAVVRRQIDRSLSDRLRRELLDSDPPQISRSTLGQLAKWCNTNNPVYRDGMDVARKLSQLLFGSVLDRSKLGV
jgi:hypothetical protein